MMKLIAVEETQKRLHEHAHEVCEGGGVYSNKCGESAIVALVGIIDFQSLLAALLFQKQAEAASAETKKDGRCIEG